MKRTLDAHDKAMVEAFYAAMEADGVRFLRLRPFEKRVGRGRTWEKSVIRKASDVLPTLEAGWNVGLLLVGKGGIHPNPAALCIIDQDSNRALECYDPNPFNFMVSRGHPEKFHLYSRMADPTLTRRSAHFHASHDVKLTGIVVGPGSRHIDGGVYRCFSRFQSDDSWELWQPGQLSCQDFPAIDPKAYAPDTRQLVLRAKRSPKTLANEWRVVSESDDWSGLNYVTDQRPLGDRMCRGLAYVQNRIHHGIVSRSGAGGRATLLVILTHLSQYLLLPEAECLALLNAPCVNGQSWNDLCRYADSSDPYPWSMTELESALAATQHFIPLFGVLEYERQAAKRRHETSFKDFLARLDRHTRGRGFHENATLKEIYLAYLQAYNLTDSPGDYDWFGKALKSSVESGQIKLRHKKIHNLVTYRGLELKKYIGSII